MTEKIKYTTQDEVLDEAGFLLTADKELLSGATDDVNKTFLTAHRPILSDKAVVVVVNDGVAETTSVDAEKGQIALSVAPATGAEVTAIYKYSGVSLDFVQKVIAEAMAWVNSRVKNYDSCYPYTEKVPRVISMVTRIYAAGLLLAKDYGYNTDTELTSKDGYKKLQFAKDELEDYITGGGCKSGDGGGDDIDNDGGIGSITAGSKGDFFGRGSRHSDCSDHDFDRNLF